MAVSLSLSFLMLLLQMFVDNPMFAPIAVWLAVMAIITTVWLFRPFSGVAWRIRRFYHAIYAPAAVVLAATVFVFGLMGFLSVKHENPRTGELETAPPDIAVYETFRIFTLGAEPHTGMHEPTLSVARGSACALMLLLGFEVIRRLASESFVVIRLLSQHKHFIVCGLGRIGRQLVRELINAGKAVVVVEAEENNPYLEWAREEGAITLVADAAKPEVLKQARIGSALRLFAVTGDDAANLDIAVEACRQLEERRLAPWAASDPVTFRPRCKAHVADWDLASAMGHRIGDFHHESVDLDIFNVFRNSARGLFRDQLIARRPTQLDQVAQYVIVGFGPMGATMALELAELAHFENEKRPRITILERDIDLVERRFRARFPRFAPSASVQHKTNPFILARDGDDWKNRTLRPEKIYQFDSSEAQTDLAIEFACNASFGELPDDMTDEKFIEKLQQVYRDEKTHGAIIICLDDDNQNFAAAERLRSKLDLFDIHTPVFAWLPTTEILHQFMKPKPGSSGGELIAFGSCSQSCSFNDIERPEIDFLGEEFHQDWLDTSGQPGPAWAELPEEMREANRSAAMHAHVKLAAAGYRLVFRRELKPIPLTIGSQELTVLARMEQNRWVAERLLRGWRYGPRSNKKQMRRELRPWDKLDPDAQTKSIKQVKRLFENCQKHNFRLVAH